MVGAVIPVQGDATLLCYKEHISVASPSPETGSHIKHKAIGPRKCDHSSFLNSPFQNNLISWRDTGKHEMSTCQRARRCVFFSARDSPAEQLRKSEQGYVWGNTWEPRSHNLSLPLFPEVDDEKINILFWNGRVFCSSFQTKATHRLELATAPYHPTEL